MDTLEEPVDKPPVQPSEPAGKTTTTTTTTTVEQKPAAAAAEDVHRFEGKVTPEQELSASVARKRRNISKKRSASAGRPRDQTPVREIPDKQHSSDEEQVSEPPPKTPERRKSKSNLKVGLEATADAAAVTDVATETKTTNVEEKSVEEKQKLSVKSEVKQKAAENAQDKQQNVLEKSDVQQPTKSPSKTDMSSLLSRAKQSATKEKPARMKKDVKKIAAKRSQSAPRTNEDRDVDQELVESFKKAQILSAALELDKQMDIDVSSSDVSTSSSSEKKPKRPTSIPLVSTSNILRRRQLEKELIKNEMEAVKPAEKPKVIKGKRYTCREIYQKWKQFKVDYRHEYAKIIAMRNRCFNDIGLLMIFCGLGGVMFKFTEGAFENFYKCGVKRVKRDFIDTLWRGSHHLREDDWKSLARTKLRDFEEQLHTAHEAGVTSYSGQRSWSFLNAVVYAITIVTTIGYGHMYPTTTTGMALTIVYAIIGIPLFLIILTDFGKLFTRAIKFLWAFVRRLYYTGTCKQARKTSAVQEVMKGAQMMYEIATFRRPSQYNLDEEGGPPNGPPKFPAMPPQSFPSNLPTPRSKDNDTEPPNTPAPSTYEIDDEFNLPISVAIFLLVAYIFIGAVVYYMWESWDFFASFYFVFISMSTIGFGDYVPRHPICMIVSIIYLVFGLALMSMCINVVQAKLSDTFRQASAKLGATIGLRVAEEDGSIATIPPPTVEIVDVHASTKSV